MKKIRHFNKNIWFVALGALLLLAAVTYFRAPSARQKVSETFFGATPPAVSTSSQISPAGLKQATIFVGERPFNIEIAETYNQQSLGLGGREELKPNTGMFFVFPKPEVQSFWMKDMKFPIDIVWIDQNRRIVGFEKSVPVESYPDVFKSKVPVPYVLEIPAGTVETEKIEIGELVKFDF